MFWDPTTVEKDRGMGGWACKDRPKITISPTTCCFRLLPPASHYQPHKHPPSTPFFCSVVSPPPQGRRPTPTVPVEALQPPSTLTQPHPPHTNACQPFSPPLAARHRPPRGCIFEWQADHRLIGFVWVRCCLFLEVRQMCGFDILTLDMLAPAIHHICMCNSVVASRASFNSGRSPRQKASCAFLTQP